MLCIPLLSGRRITSRGQKDLDQIAGQVSLAIGICCWTSDVITMLIHKHLTSVFLCCVSVMLKAIIHSEVQKTTI